MTKVLFSDFDGVLFDTIKEAYIICRYAFSGTKFFDNIDMAEYQRFYHFKYLVYNSWQYYYLMKVLNSALSNEELVTRYNFYMENRDIDAEKNFDNKYYEGRKELMNNFHGFWDKLETPFEFFYLVKDKVMNKTSDLIIVSKKNKPAVEYRLKQYGLTISEKKIFGKDELTGYQTKADFIHEFMKNNGISESVFVDDNSNNLEPCKKYPEITPLLAGWGNIKVGETGLSAKEIMKYL